MLTGLIRKLRAGRERGRRAASDGREEGVQIGPLIDEGAAADVLAFVDDAVAKGAQVVTGGRRGGQGACFVEPTADNFNSDSS